MKYVIIVPIIDVNIAIIIELNIYFIKSFSITYSKCLVENVGFNAILSIKA